MFLLGVLCTLLAIASAESNVCYYGAKMACSPASHMYEEENPVDACNSKYGSIDNLLPDLQAYAIGHIEISFEFLLMSSYFGNYKSNRDGFKALYRKYSDEAWEKAINIIQYITKRGGEMNFNQPAHFRKDKLKDTTFVYDLDELQSLAKALDMQKQMATEALNLHNSAKNHKDAAVAHYIEEEFIEKQSEVVRTLAGYTSDLKNLLYRDSSLGFFLFNDYIKSTI